jgi:hypothetical protein
MLVRSASVTTVAAALAICVAAVSAYASRAPTTAERAAIAKAVKSSSLTSMVPDGDYDVKGIRISTVSTRGRRYGRVRLAPHPGVMTDGAYGVVRRVGGRWRLIDLGTSGVGCNTAPPAVRRDLKLPCP